MAQRLGIRWTKSLNKELSNEVKNFNARVQRAIKAGHIKPEQVPKVKVSDIKKNVKTKRDLTRELNVLRRATAETLITENRTTLWQKDEQRRASKRKSRSKESTNTKILRKLDDTIIAPSRGRFMDDRDRVIKTMGLENTTPTETLANISEYAKNNAGTERWRQNYLQRLDDIMVMERLTQEEMDRLMDIRSKIASMSIENYIAAQVISPAELSINNLYVPEGDTFDFIISEIESAWSDYV